MILDFRPWWRGKKRVMCCPGAEERILAISDMDDDLMAKEGSCFFMTTLYIYNLPKSVNEDWFSFYSPHHTIYNVYIQ